MKMRRCFGLLLALSVVVSSFGVPALAAETRDNAAPISAIERASGWFNETGHFDTTVSAGKIKKLGSEISLKAGESVNFIATYSPDQGSVDFGVLDSDNVFIYINVTGGSVDDGVTIEKSGKYTPAIRNNSSNTIYVSGTVEC